MNEIVSIVIPTYNRKKTVRRAIESCLEQTYENIEIVICDDQSTDGTYDYLHKIYSHYSKIKLCSTKGYGKGPQVARNIAISNSSGKYVAFLDSDDFLTSSSIVDRVNAFDDGTVMVYGDVYFGNGNIKRIEHYSHIDNNNRMKYIFEELAVCIFSSIMAKKSSLIEIGMLDETLPAWQDDDTAIRLVELGNVKHCGEIVANIGISQISVSKSAKNAYLGCKLLVKKNKNKIIKYASIRRYVLWCIRITQLKLKYMSEISSVTIMKMYYEGLSNKLREYCKKRFIHIYM